MAAGDRGINTNPGAVEGDDGSDIWLGVPSGYTVTRPSGTVTSKGDKGGRSTQRYGYSTLTPDPDRTVAPRYRKGDENKPPRNSPEYIAGYQQELIAAGLLKKGFRAGRWDEETIKAWKKVLEYANRAGLSAREALNELKDSPLIDLDGAEGRARIIELTPRTDIETVAERLGPELLGRKLTENELVALVSGFNALESSAQTNAYNAYDAGAGTVTGAPQLQSYIEQQAKQVAPDDYQARRMADLSEQFLASIQGNTQADRTF